MSLGPKTEYERKFYAVKKELANSTLEVRCAMDSLEDFLASSLNKDVTVEGPTFSHLLTPERYTAGLITAYQAQRMVHQCSLLGYYQLAADAPSDWPAGLRMHLAIAILEHEQAVERLDLHFKAAMESHLGGKDRKSSSGNLRDSIRGSDDIIETLQEVLKSWKNNRKS